MSRSRVTSSARAAGIAALFGPVVACAALDGVSQNPCDAGVFDPDAGVVDAGVVDAGFCAAPTLSDLRNLDDGGEGAGGLPIVEQACQSLRERVCGADNACEDDSACVAADLMDRFEPERCSAALADVTDFPPCTAAACELLVDKVCGPGTPGACEDAPGCAPARVLFDRAAEDSCGAALADETLFPPCAG